MRMSSSTTTVVTMEPRGGGGVSMGHRLQSVVQELTSLSSGRSKDDEDRGLVLSTRGLLHLMMCVVKRFWAFSSLTVLAFLLLYYVLGGVTTLLLLMMSLSGLFYQISDKLLYHPDSPASSRLYVPAPTSLGLHSFQSDFVYTSDRTRLHLFFIESRSRKEERNRVHHENKADHDNNANKSKKNERCDEGRGSVGSSSGPRLPAILYLHGNAGNIGHRLMHAKQLMHTFHCHVCLLEYRGYGHSDGQPNESGLYNDAETGLNYLMNHSKVSKVIVFGRSLGGAVAIHLASMKNNRERIDALILENTFTSIPDMARCMFNLRIVRMMPKVCYKNVYDSRRKICGVSTPTLFISGLKDSLIPPSMMSELFEHCGSEHKRLATFKDGNHNDTWLCHNYTQCIAYFLTEVAKVMDGEGGHRMDMPKEIVSSCTMCI